MKLAFNKVMIPAGGRKFFWGRGEEYNLEDKNPFLSICIPTYNRIIKLQKLVLNILKSPLQDIEIVILDNCSTDNTLNILSEIKDKRLAVYSNEKNIGGLLNAYRVLQYAKGLYSLLCLDKDFINVENLEDFVYILKKNTDVDIGYCNLYITGNNEYKRYYAGFDAVIHLAYLSKHPSGSFYKTEKYKNTNILKKIFTENACFPFNNELINAELASCGDGMIVNVPIIITETEEEADKINSLTYNYKNLFFLPNQRINEYCYYMTHIFSLSIQKNEKYKLLAIVFKQGLFSCSIAYKNIMKNKKILQHYSMEPAKISSIDCAIYGFRFLIAYMKLNIDINYLQKIILAVKIYIFLLIKLIK